MFYLYLFDDISIIPQLLNQNRFVFIICPIHLIHLIILFILILYLTLLLIFGYEMI